MKFSKFILVNKLLLLMIGNSTLAADPYHKTPWTKSELLASVQQLKDVEDSGKYSEKLSGWTEGKMKVVEGLQDVDGNAYTFHQKRNHYFGDGKFNVRIAYLREEGFPQKYISNPTYKDNPTLAFAEHWNKKLCTHYLGDDFQDVSAIVAAVVKNRVVIDILVSSSSELSDVVMNDSRILSIRHIGTPNDYIIKTK